jgi:hypothetical protein
MGFINILVVTLAIAACDPDEVRSNSAEETAHARESSQRLLELAGKFEFFAGSDRKAQFELQTKPVLTYSNPVRGEVYGHVFVWTDAGRPEVVGAIFDYRSENRFDSEFHLLSNAGTVGYRDGRSFLDPKKPGIEFRTVPRAPPPARSPPARLRQMRDMARDFTIERDHPEQKKEFMRLLPQPIYRYSSSKSDVVDGALFVYVEGTDPEAFLLLEAAGAEEPVWQFAFARMNLVEFWGRYQAEVVWHVAPTNWTTVFEKQEPYAIVREQPRRGFDRSR